MKFECLKCGFCCRNLNIECEIKIGTVKLGLFLMPGESKLFSFKDIEPMYGAGLKGRARPRPEVVFAYQFSGNVCLHLGENNLCKIYDYRPIACKEYPLEVMLKPFPNLAIDPRCCWKKKHFPNQEPGDTLPKASADLSELRPYMNIVYDYIKRFAERYNTMWIYDLQSNQWYKFA